MSIFNSLEVKEDRIIVKTILGKKHEYTFEEYSLEPWLAGFSIYGLPFAEYLKIRFINKSSGKSKKYGFVGYKRKIVNEMLETMSSNIISEA